MRREASKRRQSCEEEQKEEGRGLEGVGTAVEKNDKSEVGREVCRSPRAAALKSCENKTQDSRA